jgi:hypothetical protein
MACMSVERSTRHHFWMANTMPAYQVVNPTPDYCRDHSRNRDRIDSPKHL